MQLEYPDRRVVTRGMPMALMLTLALLLAACGSRLDPETVAAAGGTQVGQGAVGDLTPGGEATGPSLDGPAADPGTSTDPGSDPGTAATGGGSGGASGGGSGGGGGSSDPDGGGKPSSCDGFANQTGVTDSKIAIANASDISGPIPGLFEASQDAVRAYVAYFNASSDICGRKLELLAFDSRTDAGADQQAYVTACDKALAAVGSMSAFDSGGAATAQKCGLPDIRSASVTQDRARCTTCFGAQSANSNQFQNAVPDYLLKTYGEAGKHAAMLYINAGAAAENGPQQARAMEKRGMNFDYVQGIDVSEFNYAPYVQQMKDKGIQSVQWLGAASQAVRLAQAMQQQNFKPKIFLLDPTGYDPRLVETGGSAVEGAMIFLNFTPFEEAASNKEVQTYISWLRQVKPNATPSFFGLFSWSAARLFVERATALGGKLSRPALVNEFGKTAGWTANGMHSPQAVGAKDVGPCWRFIKLKSGRWTPEGPTKYMCNGVTQVG